MRQEIWVINDSFSDCKGNGYYGMLSKAYELALTGSCSVAAVCIGHYDKKDLDVLFSYGADRVLYYEYNGQSTSDFCRIIEQMIYQHKPKMLMFPYSDLGKGAATAVSVEFEAGLTAECIDIEMVNHKFIYKRAAVNSSAIAQIQCTNCEIEICTVKKTVFSPHKLEYKKNGNLEIIELPDLHLQYNDSIQILIAKKKQMKKFKQSKVIFSFGRGIGNKDNLELLYKIANILV